MLEWLCARAKYDADREYAENFRCRRLYSAIYNALAKDSLTEETIWPLDGDKPKTETTPDTLDGAAFVRFFGETLRKSNLPDYPSNPNG